ncbi:sulfotransferase family 2 domain-containing protein [Roseovarius sp. MMSF_3281]|uniref:sulfotransferase family 2 domain-containing protein n=1 Tax=Roseovarius sp. MMSF_3281 TaxID=3046694 RepID=UPI00273FE9F6|nr:sulfotransferase family 2 domain-containing protein [Roseovarius sp. MMSF_3281]
MVASETSIVFLHIPKTAGQTIHSELARVMGETQVSPIRVHTQAKTPEEQFPEGYRLYSGHIDWVALDKVPQPRFVFTVLRDPLERIASFYFYLLRQAQDMTEKQRAEPSRVGMRMIMDNSVDDYFFGGNPQWKKFINDHYNSPYCAYLVTGKIRGFSSVARQPRKRLVNRAVQAAEKLNAIYSVDRLDVLERDLEAQLGINVDLTGRFVNAAPKGQNTKRWPQLEKLIERDETRDGLMDFARADQVLMHRLGLGPKPPRLEPRQTGSD